MFSSIDIHFSFSVNGISHFLFFHFMRIMEPLWTLWIYCSQGSPEFDNQIIGNNVCHTIGIFHGTYFSIRLIHLTGKYSSYDEHTLLSKLSYTTTKLCFLCNFLPKHNFYLMLCLQLFLYYNNNLIQPMIYHKRLYYIMSIKYNKL